MSVRQMVDTWGQCPCRNDPLKGILSPAIHELGITRQMPEKADLTSKAPRQFLIPPLTHVYHCLLDVSIPGIALLLSFLLCHSGSDAKTEGSQKSSNSPKRGYSYSTFFSHWLSTSEPSEICLHVFLTNWSFGKSSIHDLFYGLMCRHHSQWQFEPLGVTQLYHFHQLNI